MEQLVKPWEVGFVPFPIIKPVVIKEQAPRPENPKRGRKRVSLWTEEEISAMRHIAYTEQEAFRRDFITSTEIYDTYGVSRTILYDAQVRGMIPQGILIKSAKITLWRREFLMPYLTKWIDYLTALRTTIQ